MRSTYPFFALLIAAAPAGAQEFSLSGEAKAGLVYDSDDAGSELSTLGEVGIVVSATGETDTDLSFGALIEFDEDTSNDAGDATDNNGVADAEVFLSGRFGTLRFGDVDPATDGFGIADPGFSGLGIDDVAEQFRNATAGADVGYEYSNGGFTLIASAEIGEARSLGVAAQFARGPLSLGLGYIDDADAANSAVSVTAGYSFGAVAVQGLYSDWSSGGQGYGVDVSVDTGRARVTAAWAQARGVEADAEEGLGDAYGIGLSVPLSGGLTVSGGVGVIETDAVVDGSRTVADFGVTMNF